ncbi:acyl-CoA N-acyltransferase [Backusella circina FSU 941]|nr:acyl-CoA N-acyltransferase [Backusella circina FSU 941]
MMELKYGVATLDDLPVITALEAESYHPDEAASPEQLKNRLGYASESGKELFYVAREAVSNEVVAFVCNTLSSSPLLTDESMSQHEVNGKTICLHSVCVSLKARKQGVATRLLEDWIKTLRDINAKGTKKYDRIALISRLNLIKLYGSVGFVELGKSHIVHGPDPWYDMVLEL